MKKFVQFARIGILAVILTATATASFAGPGKTLKLDRVQNEVRRIVDTPSQFHPASMGGEADVYFSIDADHRIHVKGVFSTSDALATYVQEKLDGAILRQGTGEAGTAFRMKIRLQDLR